MDFYRSWLWIWLLQPSLRLSVVPVTAEPVYLNEAVIENSFGALHSPFSLLWKGKLYKCPLWVILVCHLRKTLLQSTNVEIVIRLQHYFCTATLKVKLNISLIKHWKMCGSTRGLTCRLTMVPNLLKCSLSLLMLLSSEGICRTSSLVLRENGGLLW